ncbi:sugar phosphate isomerase/epimerase family protein [Actinomadura roseirufa]|uniref:sugar phosphate isomerase/epimerase family protein n=1 Tax=Actinomadura roseirufa TaxID=2094049 RepID=UPI001F5F8E01|nr:TIM barrel protein [Actinomadura roseirufa]
MAPGRVLEEMRGLGITATEQGPDGFLPRGRAEREALLASYGLGSAGAFARVVLHDPARDPLPEVERALDAIDGVLMLVALPGPDGHGLRPGLDTREWTTLLANLDAITRRAADRGRVVTLHPQVGTVVERCADVERVLGGCSVPLCLDTGHLLVGGTEPLWLVRFAAARIGHVHLKDVDMALAGRVLAGEFTYAGAVKEGLFRPLGEGDVDIAGIIRTLSTAGYQGWYVLEQDAILEAEPAPGEGPRENVRRSLDYLTGAAR